MSRRYLIILIIIAGIAFMDQLTKAMVAGALLPNQSVEVIPGLFNIVYWMNPGAAFGIFSDMGTLRTVFLIGVSFVAIVVIVVLIRQSTDTLTDVSLSMVAGGAVGNLIDRVRFGEVTDFLDFYVGTHHWPAFNVADSCISVGVALLLYCFYVRGDNGGGEKTGDDDGDDGVEGKGRRPS